MEIDDVVKDTSRATDCHIQPHIYDTGKEIRLYADSIVDCVSIHVSMGWLRLVGSLK